MEVMHETLAAVDSLRSGALDKQVCFENASAEHVFCYAKAMHTRMQMHKTFI